MTTTEEIECLRQHVEYLRELLKRYTDEGNATRVRLARGGLDEALARLRKLEGEV